MATVTPSDTDALVRARVGELLESWQPWHRRLWDVGTVLSMYEAVEAADWVGRHVLSPASLSWFARESLLPRLKNDGAIGGGDLRREIHEVCSSPLKPGARSQRTLALVADLTADGYLRRWRDLIAGGPVHVERSARCVAAHLLDEGFHQDFLYGQVKSRLGRTGTAVDLIELSYERKIRAADPRLHRDLGAIEGNNRQRAQRLVQWLATKPGRPASDLTATAAFERMQELATAPSITLRRVNGYLRGSFRRLYRQRNIVLHGGSTRSIALAATVRTAGPLVGAALDRLAHGHAVAGAAPLDLASRAELAMRIAGNEDGWRIHDLLGT